jgi:hypothetical protein
MRERPIIFSAPMVRAILEGRKTQTRRVVKPQPPAGHDFAGFTACSTCRADVGKAVWGAGDVRTVLREKHRVRCPYGQPGNRLWVRESLGYCNEYGHFYAADRTFLCSVFDDEAKQTGYSYEGDMGGASVPSIHLPRRWSRITLEVTGVRVERLQDISNDDARAEGVLPAYADQCVSLGHPFNALPLFRELWGHINGPDSWDANPWVWVVEFRRIDTGAV